ncbi:MAG: pimeloyl-ACP methyl ester carboxylesterase [Halieaceae bacterium]|jgi:pimeloyl-ACP methyl ester carboxylesterase
MKAVPLSLMLCLALLIGCDDNDSNRSNTPTTPEPTEPPTPAPITLQQETKLIPSAGKPEKTPGSPGVVVTNPKLLAQFGEQGPNLNNGVYTRYHLSDAAELQPDAIVVLVPGFEGGASNFNVLAEQLMRRSREETAMIVEVWAMDRRSEQLEDRAGLDLAEQETDSQLGLDFLFGEELGLALDPRLADTINRRLITYNASNDLAFIANWTTLVHSQDIDAVVEEALSQVRSGNVFLGGHSAGTGYAARYAATDFDPSAETVAPGYSKVRGLILLEGGGGGLSEPPSQELLDRIEARFDGGLFGAVNAQAPRCTDGITACSIETEFDDCAAFANSRCTESTDAYATGLINTATFAAGELVAMDADFNGDANLSILQQNQNNVEGNNAIEQVDSLFPVRLLIGSTLGTSVSLYGQYLDDDGFGAAAAPFLAHSIGALGPEVDGLTTWLNPDEELPASALVDNGPAPTDRQQAGVWGVEVEPINFEGRILTATYRGETNFFDWYYPSSGLTVTSGLGLDTSTLSAPPPLGRGRTDIDNRTEAKNINIPVIGFGGSNGLTPVPAAFLQFARAIAPCASTACDGVTARIVDDSQPSTAFPTYGEISGGFEVYISQGYAHNDVLSAEDREDNKVIGPLVQFLQRHSE